MPYKYECEPLTIDELADIWGKNPRTIRTWLTGLPPDVKGTGGRGNASRWYFYRFMRHMGAAIPWIEIGIAFSDKLDSKDVRDIADIVLDCQKSDQLRKGRAALLMKR